MATSPSVRYLEHELTVYRRLWRSSIVSSFLAPILFLAANGGTDGKAIDRHGIGHFGGVSYLVWLAPGLMAANAMQIAVQECFHPVLGGFKWTRNFLAAAATPLQPDDIVGGWLTWVGLRALLVSAVYLLVAALFGAVTSAWAVLAVPAAALTGLAFGAPATAWSATRQRDESFSALQRFAVLPLWHGVALCRALALGRAGFWASVGHVVVLTAYFSAGTVAAVVAFRRRLRS